MESKVLENFPDSSRVWVYTSSRKLEPEEIAVIKQTGNEFVTQWLVHGRQLRAAFDVLYNQFLVMVVDESVADISGCGIDSSVGYLKKTEEQFDISLLDKMNLAYRQDKTGEITIEKMHEFGSGLDSGAITEDTVVFNNLVNTLGEMRRSWETPLLNSWHKQLMR